MKKLILILLLASISTVVSASSTSYSAQVDKPQLVALIEPAKIPPTPVTRSPSIKDLVTVYAKKHGIPVDLAHAIVKVESNYKPRIRGSSGEYGLGQIMCGTAKGVGFKGKCSELLTPSVNLEYSMRYLKIALDETNNNFCRAAMYYNSGHVPKGNKKSQYCKKVLNEL
jgi:soluble lytic murein transglycosylase-like protein